jgi:hypothetical protein
MRLHNETQKDSELLASILDFIKASYISKDDHSKIKAAIMELAKVDGEVCRFEKSLIHFIDTYLEAAAG